MTVYIEAAGTLWIVEGSGGDRWEYCAEQAGIHAAVTGSKGASFSAGDPDDPSNESFASVTRARDIHTDEYGRME